MANTDQTLALGTVQFGLDYGISNKSGITSDEELKKILQIAEQEGIFLLDSAEAYGNSIERIESLLPEVSPFQIVYKVLDIKKSTNRRLEHLLRSTKLKLHTFMFHRASDLVLKEAQLVLERMPSHVKIGVSVYEEDEIIDLLSSSQKIDVIQLPINIFDQRLLESGILEQLKKRSIEIHARSVFLQGLLLMNSADLPEFFHPIFNHFRKYETEIARLNVTRTDYALSFVKSIKEIDKVIVGVNNSSQLLELITSYKNIEKLDAEYSIFSLDKSQYIDPRKW